MYNNQNGPIQNLWHNTTKTQKIVILSFPIILILVFIISIILIINQSQKIDPDSYHIDITNYNITDAPEKYKLPLQLQVWNHLIYANPPIATVTTATIRENSFIKSSDDTFSYTSFLLDIPEFKQTYEIKFTYLNQNIKNTQYGEDYIINISCPNYTDTAYPDSICYISNDPYVNIDQYLPYSGYTTNNTEISIQKESYIDSSTEDEDPSIDSSIAGKNFLWVSLNTCHNQDLLNEGMEYTHNWLKTRLTNPDNFLIEYYEYCSE